MTSTKEVTMLKILYSVYDKKSQTYAQPIAEINDGTAQRLVCDILSNQPQHPWTKYPEDFELVRVGTFNELQGTVSDEEDPAGTVVQLTTLHTLLKGE